MSEESKVLFAEIEDDCKEVIKQNVLDFLRDKVFNASDTDFMINHLNEKIMKNLKKITESFKFVLSIVLLKTDSSGFIQNTSSYFDVETDGVISEKFVFKKIVCIVNLFCLSI